MIDPVAHEVDVAGAPVRALFSGAALDIGRSGASPEERVRANRARLASVAGFDRERAVVMAQVHGARAITVGDEGGRGTYVGSLEGIAEADACATRASGVALLALGADCAPVVLWADDGSVVAAVHLGWRGLIAGVLGSALAAMHVPSERVHAAIGPCVGPCCYPVDEGLRSTMADRFGADVVQGDAVDLALGARRALAAAGVADDAIRSLDSCTACTPDAWFSYRRDGAGAGRHAGVIWIEGGS